MNRHEARQDTMTRIYMPSEGVAGWQRLLADTEKHWRAGRSAMTLARCWEAASGLPSGLPLEISGILAALGPAPELLLALPEHKVPLPGSNWGESQSDVFALVRTGGQTVAITIEGKVDEAFDKPLGQWLQSASDGKRQRLAYICELLGLVQPLPPDVYYQLLHRTAAAIIEARRFNAGAACMIVQSFSQSGAWFDAFARFAALFGVDAGRDRLLVLRPDDTPPLYAAWASGDPQFLLPHAGAH
jgi:hypothetical protein